MADGNRIYPVKHLVLHHSVGPDFKNVSHDTIAQWFSDIGKSRGYSNGAINPKHTYKGKKTYAMAQYAGHWHSNRWCIFALMDDPWNNVAWHAGNWVINQQSIGIENCGNYLGVTFNDIQRKATADFWRPQDKKLKGKTFINPHSAWKATACPGRIKDAIPTIIKYINSPPVVKPPVDPCKTVKAQLAQCLNEKKSVQGQLNAEKARTKALSEELRLLNEDMSSMEDENDKLVEQLDACNLKLAECQADKPCPTFWEWVKCILNKGEKDGKSN